MTLTIHLNAETESRLKIAATRLGVKPEDYAKEIIEEHLPPTDGTIGDQATLDLLARWDREDSAADGGEIEARRRELDEFKRAVNQNRLQSEGPDSRKIYP
jgi:plasmid stability protein